MNDSQEDEGRLILRAAACEIESGWRDVAASIAAADESGELLYTAALGSLQTNDADYEWKWFTVNELKLPGGLFWHTAEAAWGWMRAGKGFDHERWFSRAEFLRRWVRSIYSLSTLQVKPVRLDGQTVFDHPPEILDWLSSASDAAFVELPNGALLDIELFLQSIGFDPEEAVFIDLYKGDHLTCRETAKELGWTRKRTERVRRRVDRKLEKLDHGEVLREGCALIDGNRIFEPRRFVRRRHRVTRRGAGPDGDWPSR